MSSKYYFNDMNDITSDKIRTYVKKLEQKGYSETEIVRKIQALASYMEWAYDNDKIIYKEYQHIKDEIARIRAEYRVPSTDDSRTGAPRRHSEFNSESREIPNQGSSDLIGVRDDNIIPKVSDFESAQYSGTKHTDGIAGEFYFKFRLETYKIKSWLTGVLRRIPLIGNTLTNKQISKQLETNDGIQPISTHYNSFQPQTYIAFGFVLIVIAILGAGIYDRFFKETNLSLAYHPTPVTASRILSFQGRLTDSLGNPITTATDMRFRLYTASSGGTTLYDTGTCSITPDQDGVHNVLIGSDCGAEVGAGVFTENATVWLGVTVASDAEMTPRQQIANVAYAINSQTLQGFPLGTTASTVPFISQGGELLIAASTPSIYSTYASETFRVSGASAITIQSAGSGNILLTATESGEIRFATGGSQKAVIENGGQVGIGTAIANALLDIGGGTVTYIDGTSDVISADDLEVDGTIFGSTIDVNFTTGSVLFANSSGEIAQDNTNFFWDDTGNKLGIGTASPDGKLQVTGAVVGKALAIFNETGDQDILVASAGGVTQATLSRTGDLTLVGDIAVNGDTITADGALTIDSSSYVRIGDTNTPGSASGDDDLFVESDLEVDGVIYAHGNSIQSSTAEALSLSADDVSVVGCLNVGSATECTTQGNVQLSGILDVNGGDGSDFAGAVTFNDDVTLTLAGTENLALTSDLAGTVDVINITGTPSGSANTAYGIYLDQADSANANGYDASLVIDNSDVTGATIADGILFQSAGSGFTDFIDTPSSVFKVDGSGNITGVGGTFTGTIAANGDTITSDSNLTISATGYTRIADSATPGSATGDDDLFVESDLEVDGVLYLDGTLDTSFTAGSVVFAGTSGVLAKDNTNFFWDDTANKLGIGTASPDGKLQVTGAVVGKALVIFNETGDQNILVASAGGVTQATLSRTGDLTLVGDIAVNGDTITADGALTIDSSSYVRIGDTNTPGSATGDDDLFVESDLEVDGVIYLDGTLDP